MIQPKMRQWKIVLVASSLVLVAIWSVLQWAEQAYALESERRSACGHFEFQQFHAYSPWDKALSLWPSFGGRAAPIFFRIVDKRSGQQIAETHVHWISTSPQVTCPNANQAERLIVYLGDERTETFTVQSIFNK